MIPFVLDNQTSHTAEALKELLIACRAGPVDIATAYFNVGAFRASSGAVARRRRVAAAFGQGT